ncbi:hypothetical protein EUGRSUZ_E03938 [Eucalyptus grandis]|uniref:Uncharacterized protein n=2 Tax=Eucalyptus grandis TaxID=71139 RepID=A0ACC3L0B9_EUCGR|nr:hypothetical protein EUGRSUZ_E03938 [Eucalyptus grandis]
METELQNLIFVWISVIAALTYCRYISVLVPVGLKRLFFFLPVILLFLLLPLRLTSLTLAGLTSFFVAWLSNFKLLLLAYGKGPLVPPPSSAPLSLSCSSSPLHRFRSRSTLPQKAKLPSMARSDYVHEKVMMLAYLVHVYIVLEVDLAVVGTAAARLIGVAVEPQFNEPYLATSLQDFWGRRWNLMVTSILRPSVYEPIRSASGHLVGRQWARLPAVLTTFAVSALMHELIFYYIGRKEPTWVVMWFFLLHGVAVAVEITVKKALRGTRWQLPAEVSRLLTMGFVVATGFWLFLPSLLRGEIAPVLVPCYEKPPKNLN